MVIASAPLLVSRCAATVIVLSGISLLGACSASKHQTAVPAPAGAIAATPLSRHRVAILSGTSDAKTVSIIDYTSGNIEKSFGVTREATGISAETEEGPLLVSVGGVSRHRDFGAIESWGLGGRKLAVVPMPARAVGVTQESGNTVYVLVWGARDSRAAVALLLPSLEVQRPIPLDAGVRGLQLCSLAGTSYLVYTNRMGFVAMEPVGGKAIRSKVSGQNAACGDDGRVYAIQQSFAARTVVAMTPPDLLPVATIPVSDDAEDLYEVGNRTLLELNATPHAATLAQLPEPEVTRTAPR